ncbi:MAG: hypothetical protein QOH56_3702 [Pseudonocardiales bacterium]|jgi:hypothetical protein|nr:hypothetical protein [Pseudonocardiales bacterium]
MHVTRAAALVVAAITATATGALSIVPAFATTHTSPAPATRPSPRISLDIAGGGVLVDYTLDKSGNITTEEDAALGDAEATLDPVETPSPTATATATAPDSNADNDADSTDPAGDNDSNNDDSTDPAGDDNNDGDNNDSSVSSPAPSDSESGDNQSGPSDPSTPAPAPSSSDSAANTDGPGDSNGAAGSSGGGND